MRRKLKVVPPLYPEVDAGKTYRVDGYHTGDFVGICIDPAPAGERETKLFEKRRTRTFRVVDPLESVLAKDEVLELSRQFARFSDVIWSASR